MKTQRCCRFFILAAVAVLLNGCATSALWEEGRFATFREPNNPSNLRLLKSTSADNVLVQYTETSDSNEKTRERAYWLNQNATRIQERKKPRFINPPGPEGLTPVPLLKGPADLPAGAGLGAIVSTNGFWDFALYSQTGSLGQYQLPVYREAKGRVKQVLLTPVAVAADATIIGGVLFFWMLPGLSDTPYYAVDYR